jgi:ribonuclease E
MKKEMLINVLQPEECRIAIVEDGILEELYVERTSHESYTGNIYKGKVVNLEPAIQAAFIDFSVGRNGFLHVSDVEPQYYRRHEDEADSGPRDKPREPRPPRPEDRERPARPPIRDPEDRFRERERPDRSEKGRRDRSFGEGLVESWEATAPSRVVAPPLSPPTAPVMPPANRFTPPPIHAEREPAPAATEPAETVVDDPIGWQRPSRRSRVKEVERPAIAPFTPIEPAEPRVAAGRSTQPDESAEIDLPPSRTRRARSVEPEVPAGDPIESFRPRRAPSSRAIEPAPPMEAPRARAVEPGPASESLPRGWGRGRGRGAAESPPAPRIEPEPDLTAEFPPQLGEEDDASRSRRGRAAIRSRGGDRPAERPRTREVERVREPIAEPLDVPAAREPIARPGRGRTRPPTEPDVTRPSPHARAGEPGYVPRHKRPSGPESAEPLVPAARRDLEPDDLLDDLDVDSDAEFGTEEVPGRPGEAPKRRRRRRGRRRDRPDLPEGKGAPGTDADLDLDTDLDSDEFDDLDEPRPARPATGSRRDRPSTPPPPSFRREPAPSRDDFDFDEDEGEGDRGLDHDDDEFGSDIDRPTSPIDLIDDEIDPELEEEIRREIEEITELELEMGLRATTEARPRRGDGPAAGRSPRGGRGLSKPPLQDIFRRGDEVLVQVIKESIGTKGPTLSTYISIPGRYLVLMPGLARVGVSRKIADEGQRRRLREIMTALNPPKGLGFIVRTAGLDRTKKELARDLAYLLRLWKVILRRIKKAKAPAPIYQESDMITRTIRDIFNAEIDTIWIDEPQAFERAQEFLRVVMPKFVNRLKFYDDKVPMFHKYGLEEEIAKIQRRRVEMPEGGSIVIDQTEALVAIDVNSGNFRFENDPERTAYEMNLKAAKEIARQLRLRDLGGVICNDFIDMRDEKHRRGVEKALRDAIKRDRARTKVLRMSQFGVIEMTRQRIRPSLKRSVYEDCPECTGAGVVKTVESMSIDVMRLIALAAQRQDIRRVNVAVCPDVATYLNNRKRKEISKFEAESGVMIYVHPEADAAREYLQLDCFDAQNGEVRLLPAPPPPPRRR